MSADIIFLKPIPGYQTYFASDDGNIYRKLPGGDFVMKKPGHQTKRYLIMSLSENGRVKSYRLHRLIALAWIPNPKNLPEVNHIDENKKNNDASNLEWCTRLQNIQHSKNSIKRFTKPVIQSDFTGKYMGRYRSIVEAAEKTGIGKRVIAAVCKGDGRSAGGFLWHFENEYTSAPLSLHKASKPVEQYDMSGAYIRTFESVKSAAESVSGFYNNISACCSGKSNSSHGYIWKFSTKANIYDTKREDAREKIFQEASKWKIFPDFPDYKISKDGRVYSIRRRSLLKGFVKDEYIHYMLAGSRKKTIAAHRLVAIIYIPNPKNYPQVNHKDGNRLNNRVENLEWCTSSQNNQHAHDTGINPFGRPIIQLDLDKREINRFINVATAARILGRDRGTIDDALKGKRKSALGYYWKYA